MKTISVMVATPENRLISNRDFCPGFKDQSKSRAAFHAQEFLSRVFSSEGASRFFKIFLLRFLFDSGKSASKSAGEDAFSFSQAA